MDSMFREIDIATGQLLFQWRAIDRYDVAESRNPIRSAGYTKKEPYDYFHINSVDKDDVGNYYISSRYMHTITCISPAGDILWKLGGVKSNFTDLSLGAASNFSWQHDARWHPGNRMTVFDNGCYNNVEKTADYSRGLYIQLDVESMTAELIKSYSNPPILAHSQGSMQLLPNGNTFVGWGHTPSYTEFDAQGRIICDFHYGPSLFWNLGWTKSYRTTKANWVGRPRTLPSVAMNRARDTISVSWNGATEVVT
jgi:hypothetical protein